MKVLVSLNIIFLVVFAFEARAEPLKSLVQQIQKRYEATQTSSFDFKQKTYVQVLEKHVHKEAKASFKKPGKFIIQYQGPTGRQYLSDGKKLFVYQKGDYQVQSYDLQQSEIPTEALSFLGGLSNLQQDFAVEKPAEQKIKKLKLNKALKWLELTPFKKQSSIEWIVLGVHPESFYTQELYLHTDSGNLSHYLLENRQSNFEIPDKKFRFKKKGVKEIKN